MPTGLYLIKSGMCKAILSRVVTQRVKPAIQGKNTVNENNELFRQFDPSSSLLGGLHSNTRLTQNALYKVTENVDPKTGEWVNGTQIRGEIVYDEIMQFSQIAPGQCFGGRVLPPFESYMNLKHLYQGH